MIEVHPLSKNNFNDFILLLQQRGEAPSEYYEWKYLQQPYDFFPTGFIAYDSKKPVGCIGNINRIFVDRSGNEHKATWFADWFVSKAFRGRGIGELLMKSIYDLSDYGCGIPGPAKAQKTAQQAGYLPISLLSEKIFVLNPFTYGYKIKSNNFFFIKLSYGIYLWVRLATFKKTLGGNFNLIFSKPESPEFQVAYNHFLKEVPHFKRDVKFLNWITGIPFSKGNSTWWYVNNLNLFTFGTVETQTNGLRVAKIFECFSNSSQVDVLGSVLGVLYNCGIDVVKLVGSKITNEEQNATRLNLPFHVSNLKYYHGAYLSILDKESSWINLQFQ